jgi:hypothetical protein
MKPVLHLYEHNGAKIAQFYCAGCSELHQVHVAGVNTPVWGWDGNVEKPTFSPSILVTSRDRKCHSFVRDGKIEFLSDCTHEFAGIPLPLRALISWPEHVKPYMLEQPAANRPTGVKYYCTDCGHTFDESDARIVNGMREFPCCKQLRPLL